MGHMWSYIDGSGRDIGSVEINYGRYVNSRDGSWKDVVSVVMIQWRLIGTVEMIIGEDGSVEIYHGEMWSLLRIHHGRSMQDVEMVLAKDVGFIEMAYDRDRFS